MEGYSIDQLSFRLSNFPIQLMLVLKQSNLRYLLLLLGALDRNFGPIASAVTLI